MRKTIFGLVGCSCLRQVAILICCKKFRPDIFDACKSSTDGVGSDLDMLRINKYRSIECPSDSVDYAVTEKTEDAVVESMDIGWSDIGSWASLWDISKKDKNGNVSHGDVILHGTNNSFVRSYGKLFVTVDDLISVSTKDALMVAHKDRVKDAKIIFQKLKDDGALNGN